MSWRGRTWSGDETQAWGREWGSLLREAGLDRGACVGVFVDNSPLFVAGVRACREQGLVAVPLSPSLPDAALSERFQRLQLDGFVVHEKQAARLERLAPGAARVEGGLDATKGRVVTGAAAASQTNRPALREDVKAVLFTSGTTGTPRAWGYPESALVAHKEAASKRLGMDHSSVASGVLPLHHAGGFMLLDRVTRLGAHLVLEDDFDAKRVLDSIKGHDVTHVSMVPVMFSRLLEQVDDPPESLRCVLLGGDAVPRGLLQRACGRGWPVFVSYGLTETCSQVATATPEQACAHPGSAGFALDGARVWVQGEDGARLPPGAEGRIVVEGGLLAVEVPNGGGSAKRLVTEDLGHVDDEGRLFVTGRSVHRIVTGGHTVSALRVEGLLEGLPGVRAACVVGLPDEKWGQVVAALVEADAGSDAKRPAREDVSAGVKDVLAAYERPRRLVVVGALPRTALGKKDRGAARVLLAAKDPYAGRT